MGEKERQYALLGFALLFALLAGFNFLYLNPVRDEQDRVSAQLSLLQKREKVVATPKEKEPDTIPHEQVARIAEAVPVKPYTDQLIKDLDKLQTISRIEIVSASFKEQKQLTSKEIAEKFIPKDVSTKEGADKDIETFSKNPVMPANGGNGSGGKTTETPSTNSTSTSDAEQKKEQPPTVAILQQILPEASLGSVEITLSIKGNYADIYDFVTEVQGISRYLRVDQLNFATKQKDEFTIPKDTKMTASITLTSYFAPQFASLLPKLPPVNVENPSGKWDPMQYGVNSPPKQEDTTTDPSVETKKK